MKNLLLLILFSLSSFALSAQQEEIEVGSVIDLFFKGLNSKDTALISSTLMKDASLERVEHDEEVKVKEESISVFLNHIGESVEEDFEERVIRMEANMDQPLAMVWAPYNFYREGELSHCGANLFTLIKTARGWKIHRIIDTRRTSGCE